MTTFSEPPTLFHPDVEIRVSNRRKKTAGAHWEGDRIIVVVPAHLKGVDRDTMVDHLAGRLARHRPHLHASDSLLEERAIALGDRHLDGIRASSIRWSTTQLKRWGSCTPLTREIRISEQLRVVPAWVLDAVIVHELAHLIEPSHNPWFKSLENRYPRRADADIFLDGYSLGLHMPSGQSSLDDDLPSEPSSGEVVEG
jgi:hypothetical protein